jgi:HD-GYP domain-containing protein (c-di-GMP phosphodiesterase class II)
LFFADAILACHENWDGSGYPLGLKGEGIPITSRIIHIVDAYDVMRSGRPYKKTMSKANAIKELRRNAGTQFDSNIAGKFIELLKEH